MKNKRLKLNELAVQSFVTSQQAENIKAGGSIDSLPDICLPGHPFGGSFYDSCPTGDRGCKITNLLPVC